MPAGDLLETFASFPLFAPVPRAELEWLCERGDVRHFTPGDTLLAAGTTVDEMWIVLAGRFAVQMQKEGAWRKVYDTGRGTVMGAMPYSRARIAPGRLVAEDDASVHVLDRSHFAALVKDCPELTEALVHQMIDRAREFHGVRLHDERMQSLGRLASGLAHELNNPASGAARHARSLPALLDELHLAGRALARARLTDAQLECVDALRRLCAEPCAPRSPLEAADREDELSDWLVHHDIDAAAAPALAEGSVTLAALDEIAHRLPAETLPAAIRWAAGDVAVRQVASQVVTATGRIHDLVSAVKGFTFMDREGVPTAVDVARGLADTVAMLESKSRAKSVRVRLETAADLPPIHGYGSELNQVWEKLIDNAIDAARADGTVTVTASRRGDVVAVRVVDDGPGIPEEHRARIFDPFFTTKPVGAGTGLGLDIARRFAHLHDGDVDFTSQPGHTVFRVQLPVTGARPLAPRSAT